MNKINILIFLIGFFFIKPTIAQVTNEIKVVGEGSNREAAIDNAFQRAMQVILTEYFKEGLRGRIMASVESEILEKGRDYVFSRRIVGEYVTVNTIKVEMIFGIDIERIRRVLDRPSSSGFGGQSVGILILSDKTQAILGNTAEAFLKDIGENIKAFFTEKGFPTKVYYIVNPEDEGNREEEILLKVTFTLSMENDLVFPRLLIQATIGQTGLDLADYDEGGRGFAIQLQANEEISAQIRSQLAKRGFFQAASQEIYYRICRQIERSEKGKIYLLAFSNYNETTLKSLEDTLSKLEGVKSCRRIKGKQNLPIFDIRYEPVNYDQLGILVEKSVAKIEGAYPTLIWRVGSFIYFKR